jgi:flagellar biogenesis protein FliO
MQKLLIFLLSALMMFQGVSFSANEPPPPQHTKAPDFSPPKDLSGPVFPPEDVLGEPGPENNRFLSEFINMAATLGLLIGLILMIAWFLKRMVNTRQEQGNATSIIKIIERRSLSPKSVVFLLEVESKTLVVAESVNGVTLLTEYNSPEEEEEAKIPSAFNKLLEKS